MTRPTLVVDASVAIKWVVPEGDSDVAESLVGRYRLVAPHLIYAECANILWRKLRRNEITADELRRATMVVDDFAVDTVSMRELVPLAIDLSIRLDHAAYDCFYVALAILEDCRMVTADEKLLRKVRSRFPPEDAARYLVVGAFGPDSR